MQRGLWWGLTLDMIGFLTQTGLSVYLSSDWKRAGEDNNIVCYSILFIFKVEIIAGNDSQPIAYYGDACGDHPPIHNVTGRLALISRHSSAANCTFFTKVMNAQKYGAIGVVVYSTPELPFLDMNCQGTDSKLVETIKLHFNAVNEYMTFIC